MAALAAIVLLLSGCLASSPAPVASLPEKADDGVLVTATRVEPLVHLLDRTGRLHQRPCGDDECAMHLQTVSGHAYGLDWDDHRFDFGDPLALFWRVQATVEWLNPSPVPVGTDQSPPYRLAVYVTTPCGVGCLQTRHVVEQSVDLEQGLSIDIYLEPGEMGVRLALEDWNPNPGSRVANDVEYRIQAQVSGFRAVAAPVVIS